jgi:hypothetical protein
MNSGSDSKTLPQVKSATSAKPYHLTPSEIKSLQDDKRQAREVVETYLANKAAKKPEA